MCRAGRKTLLTHSPLQIIDVEYGLAVDTPVRDP